MALDSLRAATRELFLLEQAERKVASLSDKQRKAMQPYQQAATSRLRVARDVRGPSVTQIALELYRQAALLLVLAFLVSRDRDLDPANLTSQAAIEKLDEALQTDGERPPPEFARVKGLLVSVNPLELDRMPAEEADDRSRDFEVTTRWLSRLFDARSPGDLKVSRIMRWAAVAAWVVAVVIVLGTWILAPKNYAKGKPATSSSTMFSTLPAGAVDGSKSGQYGFHSSIEDSPWLSIDLGAQVPIRTVKVYGRGDGYFDQSIPLVFEISDDGQNYRPIATRSEIFSADDPWIIARVGVAAQHVRLRTMRRSYLVLGEVEVFAR